MLTAQPVKDADVYLFRHILHDWSDKYAIKILQNIVPVMKNGARVIAADFLMLEATTGPLWKERVATSKSMQMMVVVNAKERTKEDWIELFRRADSRFS